MQTAERTIVMNVSNVLDENILHVVATGEFSLEEAQRTFLEVLEAIRQSGAIKVLFDGRDLSGEPTVIERFYYGEFVAISVRDLVLSGVADALPQFAYVLHEPVRDPLRLGETVAVNRG